MEMRDDKVRAKPRKNNGRDTSGALVTIAGVVSTESTILGDHKFIVTSITIILAMLAS